MQYRKSGGRRVALVTGILFLGALVAGCESMTAPEQSVAAQVRSADEGVSQADEGANTNRQASDGAQQEPDALEPVRKGFAEE
jgi:hypothetical protein